MPQLPRDDGERGVVHGQMTGVGVAQNVKRNGRFDLGLLTSFDQTTVLMGAALSMLRILLADALRGRFSSSVNGASR